MTEKWAALRERALTYPEAWEDFPWDETVVKVRKKIFAFLGGPDSARVTLKLPESNDHALSLPGAEPAGYGMAKSGWVMVPLDPVDLDLLVDWLEESYRAVAPKKLAALL